MVSSRLQTQAKEALIDAVTDGGGNDQMTEVPKIVRDRLRTARSGEGSPRLNSADAMHPDADLLTAFSEHALSPTERDGVLDHLGLCADCREVIAVALPALDNAAATIAAETDADRAAPIARKADSIGQRSPRFSWANLRWATVATAAAVMAAVLLLRPGKLNQPTLPTPNTQIATAEPPAAAAQIASRATDQVAALAKTEGVRSTPEMRSGVRLETKPPRKPDAGLAGAPPQPTNIGTLLADNRLSDEKKGRDKDQRQDSLRADLSAAPMPMLMAGGAVAPSPVSRGANETIEVASAAASVETTPSFDGPLTARAAAPAIEKAKPALKEMDASSNEANVNRASTKTKEEETTDAAGSYSVAKSQAPDSVYARKMALPAGAALSTHVTWAIVEGSLQRSLDGGQSWQSVLRADHPLQCYAGHDRTVWVGGMAGTLFHSADGGLTWIRVHPIAQDQTLNAAITHIDMLASGELVLSTSNSETWTSADGVTNWVKK